MPTVKVIGRRTTFRGKCLFELLCNLKNFGKGRVVVRSIFEDRFPDEPSYYVITKAQPKMDPEFEEGTAWGHKVFRGLPLGECMIKSGFKADWRLIPRHEEHNYLEWKRKEPFVHKEINTHMKFPPLLREMVLEEWEKMGKPRDNKEPMLPILIRQKAWNRARLKLEQNET